MNTLVGTAASLYDRFVSILNKLQGALLLAIRLYWGFQFAQDGYGKLTHLSRVAEYICIAQHAGSGGYRTVRCAGRICWWHFVRTRARCALRLACSLRQHDRSSLSVPDDRVNFSHILSNPSDFYNATPYTYWFAALLILILVRAALRSTRFCAAASSGGKRSRFDLIEKAGVLRSGLCCFS